MRRDYFICVFLFLVAASLSFVCLLPTCFSYDGVLPRNISVAETILSLVFSFLTLLAFPIIFAVKRKFWAMLGFAAYGILPYLPGMFLPGLKELLTGTEASTVANIKAFLLRDLYIMCNAPFVGVSRIFGNDFALVLPKLILPLVIVLYVAVFLFRFYREAYLAELAAPTPTAADQSMKGKAQPKEPDILGTVISAPVEEHKRQTEDTVVMRNDRRKAPDRSRSARSEMRDASAPSSEGRPNVRKPNISFDDIPNSVKGAPSGQAQAVPQGRRPEGAMPEGRKASGSMPEGRKAAGSMPEGRKAAASVNEGRKPEGALPDPDRPMKAPPKDSVIELGPPPRPQPRKDGVIELGPPPKDVPPVK